MILFEKLIGRNCPAKRIFCETVGSFCRTFTVRLTTHPVSRYAARLEAASDGTQRSVVGDLNASIVDL